MPFVSKNENLSQYIHQRSLATELSTFTLKIKLVQNWVNANRNALLPHVLSYQT